MPIIRHLAPYRDGSKAPLIGPRSQQLAARAASSSSSTAHGTTPTTPPRSTPWVVTVHITVSVTLTQSTPFLPVPTPGTPPLSPSTTTALSSGTAASSPNAMFSSPAPGPGFSQAFVPGNQYYPLAVVLIVIISLIAFFLLMMTIMYFARRNSTKSLPEAPQYPPAVVDNLRSILLPPPPIGAEDNGKRDSVGFQSRRTSRFSVMSVLSLGPNFNYAKYKRESTNTAGSSKSKAEKRESRASRRPQSIMNALRIHTQNLSGIWSARPSSVWTPQTPAYEPSSARQAPTPLPKEFIAVAPAGNDDVGVPTPFQALPTPSRLTFAPTATPVGDNYRTSFSTVGGVVTGKQGQLPKPPSLVIPMTRYASFAGTPITQVIPASPIPEGSNEGTPSDLPTPGRPLSISPALNLMIPVRRGPISVTPTATAFAKFINKPGSRPLPPTPI